MRSTWSSSPGHTTEENSRIEFSLRWQPFILDLISYSLLGMSDSEISRLKTDPVIIGENRLATLLLLTYVS